MTERDPIDILRHVAKMQRDALWTPESLIRVPDGGEDAQIRPARRTRRKLVVVIATVILGTGGGVAWALLHGSRPTNPTIIGCYQEADTDSSRIIVSSDGSDPVIQCTTAWTAKPAWGTPPPMVACVNTSQAISIFPDADGKTTCPSLGLHDLDPTAASGEQNIINFQEDLTTTLLTYGCLPPEQIQPIIRQYLDQYGLDGWTIHVLGTYNTQQPCGAIGIEPSTRSIVILPTPDIFEGDQGT